MSEGNKKVVKVKAKPVKVKVKPVAKTAAAKPEPEVTRSLFEEPADAAWSREAQAMRKPLQAKAPPKKRQTLAPMPEKLEPEEKAAPVKPAPAAAAPAEPVPAEPAPAAKAAGEPAEKPSGYVPFYKKWWFWLIIAGLALALIALIVQDRNSTGTTDDSTVSPVAGQSVTVPATLAGNVAVDDAAQTISVTLPPDFFAGANRDEIIAEAEAEGFDSCVVNNDGSVTYTMNREKQASILSDFKREIDSSISNLTTTGTSYKNITYNDTVTSFDVRVDKNAFAASEDDQSYAVALFMLGGYYQMFSGIPSDQVDVTLNFIDDQSGQTFGSVSYQEAMAGI
ncbi:MAG: hypothetical protein J6T17_02260 [Clostridia bacterium]|nr:hypothetical protein [Clostridia bacterium]